MQNMWLKKNFVDFLVERLNRLEVKADVLFGDIDNKGLQQDLQMMPKYLSFPRVEFRFTIIKQQHQENSTAYLGFVYSNRKKLQRQERKINLVSFFQQRNYKLNILYTCCKMSWYMTDKVRNSAKYTKQNNNRQKIINPNEVFGMVGDGLTNPKMFYILPLKLYTFWRVKCPLIKFFRYYFDLKTFCEILSFIHDFAIKHWFEKFPAE